MSANIKLKFHSNMKSHKILENKEEKNYASVDM